MTTSDDKNRTREKVRSDEPGEIWEILLRTGFVTAGSGPRDLSDRYKEELTRSLEAKHGDR